MNSFSKGFGYYFGSWCGVAAGVTVLTVALDVVNHPQKYVDGAKKVVKKITGK